MRLALDHRVCTPFLTLYNPTEMPKARTLLLAVALATAPVASAQTQPAAPTWELMPDGRMQLVDPAQQPPLREPTLDRVEDMIRNRQEGAARRLLINWIRRNKTSAVRDRAVFLLGQANFLLNKRMNAFYNYDELLDLYPASRYFYSALQRQYDIADAYLDGYRDKFLGIPLFDSTIQATEMLFRIQQRAPGSPLAEKALLRTADYYYADAEYDLAEDTYAAYVRSYPRSPYLPRVRLRQAFSALAQFRGVLFDATPVIDARQQLVNLAEDYPQIAREENVPALLARIDAALSKKLLATADFYRRTNKPTASAYHCRYLLQKFPQSPEAQTARERLARMPAATAAPSTQPATRSEGR